MVDEQEVNDAIEQGLDLQSPGSGDHLERDKPKIDENETSKDLAATKVGNGRNDNDDKEELVDKVGELPVSASVSILEGRKDERADRNSNPVAMSWEETK